MDYRELLKKYIDHVGEWEGTTFIGTHLITSGKFSEEEAQELIKLDKEVFDAIPPSH